MRDSERKNRTICGIWADEGRGSGSGSCRKWYEDCELPGYHMIVLVEDKKKKENVRLRARCVAYLVRSFKTCPSQWNVWMELNWSTGGKPWKISTEPDTDWTFSGTSSAVRWPLCAEMAVVLRRNGKADWHRHRRDPKRLALGAHGEAFRRHQLAHRDLERVTRRKRLSKLLAVASSFATSVVTLRSSARRPSSQGTHMEGTHKVQAKKTRALCFLLRLSSPGVSCKARVGSVLGLFSVQAVCPPPVWTPH